MCYKIKKHSTKLKINLVKLRAAKILSILNKQLTHIIKAPERKVEFFFKV